MSDKWRNDGAARRQSAGNRNAILPLSVTPGQRLRRWLVGPGGTPLLSISASFILLASLLGVATSDAVHDRWSRVTAQSLLSVEGGDFDPHAFSVRIGAIAQADLEQQITVANGDARGEIHENLECLATNVYFEARNEGAEGMAAVAHVVMNRVQSKKFPNTVCDVIHQGGAAVKNRCQFSWWCDGKKDEILNKSAWELAQLVAEDVYWERSADPTDGAMWYHADYVDPSWRTAMLRTTRIGSHLFYISRDAAVFDQLAEIPDLI